MTLNRRWLLKEYGQTDDGDVIYGLFDNETKSPYYLYSLNNYYLNKINDILNNYEKEIHELKSENQRLTDKLNQTALELVDDVISQGKAVEISEMSYSEFLDYRAENGKPMELQL